MNRKLPGLLLLLSIVAERYSVGAPPSRLDSKLGGNDAHSKQTRLVFSDYRVLFDRNQEGYAASGGSFLYQD